MRFCLSCRHLSHAGTFCGHCGRSFGCRVCNSKKKHKSPPDAQYCLECGSSELTEPAHYVPLGCVSWIIGWGCIVLLVRGLWGLISSTKLIPLVLSYCLYWCVILFLIDFFLGLIPGELGKPLRQLLFGTVRQLLRGVQHGLGLLIHLVIGFIGGNDHHT